MNISTNCIRSTTFAQHIRSNRHKMVCFLYWGTKAFITISSIFSTKQTS